MLRGVHRLSPHSLFPVPYQVTPLLREPLCPQTEALLSSRCLFITHLGEGSRKKYSGTLRSGTGSGSSDQTGHNKEATSGSR